MVAVVEADDMGHDLEMEGNRTLVAGGAAEEALEETVAHLAGPQNRIAGTILAHAVAEVQMDDL